MAEAAEKIEQAEAPGPIAFFLSKDKELAWMLMPEYLRRVRAFCALNDPDGSADADFLCTAITADFIRQKDHAYCLAVILVDGEIVGHGLAEIYLYCSKRFATVLQTALDPKSGVDISALDGIYESVKEWAMAWDCEAIQACVDEGPHERRLRMQGMKRHKIMMRMYLK